MSTIDTVNQLTSFERRGAGTDAERRAAQWLAREAKSAGREVHTETFWCRPNWALAHAWHVALALAGSLVATSAPHVGVALLTIALVSVVADALTGRSPGRRLTPERASQNVVATAAPARQSAGTAPTRLIVTANYDAGRTGLIYRGALRAVATKAAKAAGPLALGWLAWLCLAIIWLLAVAAVRAAGHDNSALNIIQVPPSVTLVIALALLLEAGTAPPGPAADDNASGTAVALALTRALAAAPPRSLSVELVLQGAGDTDNIGLQRYLRSRKQELRPDNTVVLGVAAAGAGSPHWRRTDGGLFPLRYSRKMNELAGEVAGAYPRLGARRHDARSSGPAFPARRRRLPAMTIGGGQARRSHQPTDTADGLDSTALNQVTNFGLILVDAIDAFLAAQEQAQDPVATPA